MKSVRVNGEIIKNLSNTEVVLMFEGLPHEATVEITTTGGWGPNDFSAPYPVIPALTDIRPVADFSVSVLPDSMQEPYKALIEKEKQLAGNPSSGDELVRVREALESFRAMQQRTTVDPGPGYYRPITAERRENMVKLYARSAMAVYRGMNR